MAVTGDAAASCRSAGGVSAAVGDDSEDGEDADEAQDAARCAFIRWWFELCCCGSAGGDDVESEIGMETETGDQALPATLTDSMALLLLM